MTADAYWLLWECLRKLQKRKRIAANRWLNYVIDNFGYDFERLEWAMTIRDNHDDRESLAGKTVLEAFNNRPEPSIEIAVEDQAGPDEADYGARTPRVNGDGKHDDEKVRDQTNVIQPNRYAPRRPARESSESTGGSSMSRSRLVPREAITIRSYPEIEKVVERFFTGDDPRALMILGRPGIGKDEIFQKYITKYPGLAVDPPLSGLSKPLATYKAGFDNLHRLLIITDGEGLWATYNGKELVRQFTEQKLDKWISWPTTCKQLDGCPQQYKTTSRVAFILNRWISNPADPFYEKIVDRGNLYHFDPTPYGIQSYVAEWFWDQEVFDFIASHLHHVVNLTCRAYNNAAGWKAAEEPWQRYFLERYTDDDPKWTVQRLENNASLESVEAKVVAFKQVTGLSRKTYFNYKQDLNHVGQLKIVQPPMINVRGTSPVWKLERKNLIEAAVQERPSLASNGDGKDSKK